VEIKSTPKSKPPRKQRGINLNPLTSSMGKSLDDFFTITRGDINRKLKEIIENHEDEKLEYFLKGGKRLRPLLCLLAFKASGGSKADYQNALDLAAAIELQHSASLVHDDIIDGDAARRGSSSYYKTYGIEDAILTGHKAIVLGFKNVLNHDRTVIKTLFDIWEDSLDGEIKDIEARKNRIPPLQSGERLYFDVILKKTASLFAGAALLGSQEAKAPKDLQGIFWEFGKCLGVAYQLLDDHHDIDSGMEMLPIAWLFEKMDEGKKELFIRGIDKGDFPPSKILFDLGIDVKAIFLTEIIKMKEAAEAMARSELIPENEFKPLLLEFPAYLITKCLANSDA
jgi:geranylgeranyl pyrophosphate synthase